MGQINALSIGLGGPSRQGVTVYRHQRWTVVLDITSHYRRIEAQNKATLLDALTDIRSQLQKELDRRMSVLSRAAIEAAMPVPANIVRDCGSSGSHRRHILENGDTC